MRSLGIQCVGSAGVGRCDFRWERVRKRERKKKEKELIMKTVEALCVDFSDYVKAREKRGIFNKKVDKHDRPFRS